MREYKKQNQFQLGGLVSRDINNKAIAQLYVTANVYQKNCGASIVTGNFHIILPLGATQRCFATHLAVSMR